MFKLCLSVLSSFWMLAPSGKQAEEVYKAAKEIVRHSDDFYRLANNTGFWAALPIWAWIVIGIAVIAIVIYVFFK